MFSSLILQKECCTFNNGEYVKSGLAELELWCTEVTEEYIGSSLDELNYSKQAVRFLVAQEKDELSYDDLTNDICPVTSRLKLLMTDDSGDDEKSYMLEDNSR
ncbi:putative Dilute domain-containing protein [Medicago truncatula]|uniref:Putative Dilute domain-containing protein n=1 Tax=Medicago truncatula TaxID=3880 RepID=A0A396JLS1_MEDTR|nr:putative Dilute domain-containing protein [Medicago truncatula]